MNKLYAGIGARETPAAALAMMTDISENMVARGWRLRSGNADGADTAFQNGTQLKEVHLPWPGYNKAPFDDSRYVAHDPTKQICQVAADHHPMWDVKKDNGEPVLSPAVKLLMCRNVTIVLGADLLNPVDFVCCWTPGGRLVGGTSHAMKVAQTFHIPVFNLFKHQDQQALVNFVTKHS